MLIRMVDTVPGAGGSSSEWEFEEPKVTLRVLVRERVRREVEKFNETRPEVYQGLVQPNESERLLNGYKLKTLRTLDAGEQFERAVRAFEANGFLVLAGGRQIESLDEEI